jgi:guanylate kinase
VPPAGCLFVISGPSGAGKSTVVRLLRQRRPLYFSVSATTRERRPGEVDGVHYRFVTSEQFETMIEAGQFLEWAEYNGRRYGTPLAPVEAHLASGEDVLLEIEVQGAAQIRSAGIPAVMLFVVPPSLDELEARLRRRGDTSEADIRRRLGIARAEMTQAELFDHTVINDHLERCVTEIIALIARGCEGATVGGPLRPVE